MPWEPHWLKVYNGGKGGLRGDYQVDTITHPFPEFTLGPQNWLSGSYHLNAIFVGMESPLLVFLSCFKAPHAEAQVHEFTGWLLFSCGFLYYFILL